MKKTRILSLALAVLFLATLPMTALAATHDIANRDDMYEAFANDTDANVILNVVNPDDGYLDMESNVLVTNEGQTYTLNSNSYILYNLSFAGAGTVIINADNDLVGDYDGSGDALSAQEDVSVTVNGDLSAADDGVSASTSGTVTINGDIYSEDQGVAAHEDSTVVVNGDIASGDEGIDANDTSNVTVNGNIHAYANGYVDSGDAVEASDHAIVTVNGNVLSDEEDGIDADGSAQVTVTGNVSGEGCCAVYGSEDAKIAVGGEIIGDIDLQDNATLEEIQQPVFVPHLYARDLTGKLWTTEDLEGYEAILLVYIDPADEGAADLIAAAKALQEEHGEKLLVLGVLMTEDEEAAEALDAGFPILRKNVDLSVFYHLEDPGMMVVDSELNILVKDTQTERITTVLAAWLA